MCYFKKEKKKKDSLFLRPRAFGLEPVWKWGVDAALMQQMAVARRVVLILDVMLKQ